MAITLRYSLDPTLAGPAAAAGSGAVAASQQGFRDRELAERQRQYDLSLEYNAQVQGIEGQQRAAALGEQAYQFDEQNATQQDRMAYEYQSDLMRNQAYQQQIDAQVAGQQQATERQRMSMMADLQQGQEKRQFEQALATQKAINDYKGYTSQGQFDQAVQQWEQQTGMDWGFPQRAIAERAQIDGQQRRQQFVGAMAGLTGLDQGIVDGFVVEGEGGMPMLMGVQPADLVGMGKNKQNDERMREIQDQKEEAAKYLKVLEAELAAKAEIPKAVAKAEEVNRTTYTDSQKGYGKWVAAKAKFEAEQAKYESELQSFNSKTTKLPTDKSPLAPVPPNPLEFAGDGLPVMRTPDEARRLPSGTYFLTIDGKLKRVP